MNSIQKRIITSVIVLPFSFFFIFKGGDYIVSFLYAILILGNYELFSTFKKKITIIFLDSVLVIALLSALHLRNDTVSSYILLIWIIILTIFSDIGGYVFGKTFKWKRITKISPNKTLSGVIGSVIFSLSTVLLLAIFVNIYGQVNIEILKQPKYYFLAIIFSLIAQLGDLCVSYFKRLEKIKDTGKLLPGHGGIFDRIDSLMFVVIFAYILYSLKIFP